MKSRINLTIDETLLDKVKHYASLKQRSVSDLVESYFRSVIETSDAKKNSFVDLIDDLPKANLPEEIDLKKQYAAENAEKYGF
ncbi:MAG: DUF6364 family protein [Sphingobacterium sp.]|jgi:hypothetical protein|nr:DUF6364 family protein [Sphingobacterium sp.]